MQNDLKISELPLYLELMLLHIIHYEKKKNQPDFSFFFFFLLETSMKPTHKGKQNDKFSHLLMDCKQKFQSYSNFAINFFFTLCILFQSHFFTRLMILFY